MNPICKLLGHRFWFRPAHNAWSKQPTTWCQRCGVKGGHDVR